MKENFRHVATALRLLQAHEKEEVPFEGKKKDGGSVPQQFINIAA